MRGRQFEHEDESIVQKIRSRPNIADRSKQLSNKSDYYPLIIPVLHKRVVKKAPSIHNLATILCIQYPTHML